MTKVYLTAERLSLPEDGQHIKALLHWVSQAEKKLWAEEPPYPVTDEGRMQISFLLLKRMESLATQTLDALLNDRLRACNPVLRLDIRLATREERVAASKELYKQLLKEEMRPLFQKSPLLAGYLDQGSEQFVGMIRKLLAAISKNQEDIRRELLDGELGAVTDLQCNSSDFHFHGCCTVTVSTEHGRFVYKPHDCRCDVAFGRIVERWFSDITRAPRCLARDGYGFCEFIDTKPAQNLEETDRFFENMGSLCALFHAIGSTDLHVENFLAEGRYPILVDLETVLTPVARVFHNPEVFPEPPALEGDFIYDLNQSLYVSALLPKMIGKEQYSVLFSTGDNAKAVPILDGVKQNLHGHEDVFFRGFSRGYDRCIQIRPMLLQLLDDFLDLPVRKLIRQTDYYYRQLQRLLSPPMLQSEEARRALLGKLGQYFISHGAPHLTSIAEWEAQCLLEQDIPYFCSLGGGTALLGYDEKVVAADFFSSSAVENAKNRLNRMNQAEKEFEITILKRSFDSALEYIPEKQKKVWNKSTKTGEMLQNEEAVKEAEGLFLRISERSVTSPCGKTSWLEHTGDGDSFSCVRPYLFQGTAGMGLFFAAIAAVSNRKEIVCRAKRLCGVCLEQLHDAYIQIKPAKRIPEEMVSLGLASGFGGVLRSLALIGRYLNDPGAVQLALNFMRLLREEQIMTAEGTDLFSGSAGLIEAISGAAELRETEKGRQLIHWCAEQLLTHKTQRDYTGVLLWNSLKLGRPISGMGHGMAGIGHALLRAASVLQNETYREAGMDAMRFETRAFKEKLGTWPDMRESAQGSVGMHGYCSGAPGIGLAMLDAMEINSENSSPVLALNLDRAMNACERKTILFRDHLCCGNSASADFYIEYARRTQRSIYHEKARALLSEMTTRKQALGDYTYLPPGYSSFFSSTLFYGGAGVGYELLRLAAPDKILSVLI